MFFRKIREMQGLIDSRTKALKTAEKKIERLEEIHKDLREDIEYEHLENYKNHKKLLEIEKILKEQDYNSIDNFKNKIRTILKKELDVGKTY